MFFYLIKNILYSFVRILEVLILIDAISTWIMPPRSNNFLRTIGVIIDPILEPCHRLQQKFLSNSPIDFSPLIAMFLLEIFAKIIFWIL